jgi:hypothetical protein
MKKNQTSVSMWVYILVGFVIFIGILTSFLTGDYVTGYIISIGLALLVANKCSKWAKEINKSMNTAFLIGFFFFLLGMLFYYIYYEHHMRKIMDYDYFCKKCNAKLKEDSSKCSKCGKLITSHADTITKQRKNE